MGHYAALQRCHARVSLMLEIQWFAADASHLFAHFGSPQVNMGTKKKNRKFLSTRQLCHFRWKSPREIGRVDKLVNNHHSFGYWYRKPLRLNASYIICSSSNSSPITLPTARLDHQQNAMRKSQTAPDISGILMPTRDPPSSGLGEAMY